MLVPYTMDWMCAWMSLLVLTVLPALAGVRGTSLAAGRQPAFSDHQQTQLLAAVGDTAVLRCIVMRLADRTVSWVRSCDLQILTHAGTVFTADSRVSCSEEVGEIAERDYEMAYHTTAHTLRIASLRPSDAGRYECQINTEPKLSLFFNLTVIESSLPMVSVAAVGEAEVRRVLGGAAQFSCEARYVPSAQTFGAVHAPLPPGILAALPPLTLRWEHNGVLLNPQSGRGGISLETERWEGRIVSRLTLGALDLADAGLYTCSASGVSVPLMLSLYSGAQDLHENVILGGDMEMQHDQAVPRISSASSLRPVPLATFTILAVITLRRLGT
ncbi:unnamed protein product [Leptosia nina]|uniref:Ig-like domain-containing protein n=1 Tax=Leptosia nina TaxID=320188 RepID=A0AAV1J098_9NEOP